MSEAGTDAGGPVGARDLSDALWMLYLPPAASAQLWRIEAEDRVVRHVVSGGIQIPGGGQPGLAGTLAVVAPTARHASIVLHEVLTLRDGPNALYVDLRLPEGFADRAIAALRLVGQWRALRKGGYARVRGYRLLEYDARVYESNPVWFAGRSWKPLKGIAALALRGGRVALCACKGGSAALDRILHEAGVEQDSAGKGVVYLGSGRILRLAARGAMLRIPRGAKAHARCERGFAALERAGALELSVEVPRALRRFNACGQDVFVESRLAWAGFEYLSMNTAQRAAVRARALPEIAELHARSRVVRVCDPGTFESLVAGPAQFVAASLPSAALRSSLENFLATAREALLGHAVSLVLTHGDCKIANFLQDGRFEIKGLVDWDRAQLEGLPVADLVHYSAFDRMLDRKEDIAPAILHCAQALAADSQLEKYRRTFGINDARWRFCAVMALILHAADQVESVAGREDRELREMPQIIQRACEWATPEPLHGAQA